ncbi:MAG TPA: NAD(P)H-hydrate dehydratase [Candidatus Nanopelagicaceae bacterium]|nr:NAD(P)H-hydrate dehydratase [Candidatus Nanopelagicaceae bacterium]
MTERWVDPRLTVGVDITGVERIAHLSTRRPGFVAKMFSAEEAEYCAGRPERLAARWAAKEAVRKVFGSQGRPIPTYPSIAVTHRPGGAPEVLVGGRPVPGLEVSLSHDIGLAVAVATFRPGFDAASRLLAEVPGDMVLPGRPEQSHKGTFGTVLVLAGSPAFPGAAILACRGAHRGGAGKVKVIVGAGAGPGGFAPETILVPVPDLVDGFSEDSAAALTGPLAGAQAVVCGPGLGEGRSVTGFLRAVLRQMTGRGRELVLDADALNAVASSDQLRGLVPPGCVLTPHPLEASRLMGRTLVDLQADRVGAAAQLARQLACVVVLKGAGTVVAGPQGEIWTDDHATAALASGGTGDVLSGLIGSLIAQGQAPFAAAQAGVFLHAEAGSTLGRRRGRAGILASEVGDALVEIQEQVRLVIEARSRP